MFLHYAKGASEQAGLFAAAARQSKFILQETLNDITTLVDAIEYDSGVQELLVEGEDLVGMINDVDDDIKALDSLESSEDSPVLGRSREEFDKDKVELEGLLACWQPTRIFCLWKLK